MKNESKLNDFLQTFLDTTVRFQYFVGISWRYPDDPTIFLIDPTRNLYNLNRRVVLSDASHGIPECNLVHIFYRGPLEFNYLRVSTRLTWCYYFGKPDHEHTAVDFVYVKTQNLRRIRVFFSPQNKDWQSFVIWLTETIQLIMRAPLSTTLFVHTLVWF